jgi:hypothetical protein
MAKKTTPRPAAKKSAAKKSAAKKSAPKNKGLQFTIDIGQRELTPREVSSLGNEIAKQAIQSLRGKGDATVAKEPYVRIIFVKSVPHAKVIKK